MKYTKRIICFSLLLFYVNALSAQIKTVSDTLKKRNHQLTADFLAPMTGNFTLGLESYLGKQISLDIRLGLIGAGKHDQYEKLQGFFVKLQPNFYITPNYKLNSYAIQSNFQGTYFSPVFIIGGFSYSNSSYYSYGSNQITTEALLMNLGHQFVFNNTVSFNLYGGAGYSAAQAGNSKSYFDEYYYSHVRLEGDIGFTLDGGFEIGILFK